MARGFPDLSSRWRVTTVLGLNGNQQAVLLSPLHGTNPKQVSLDPQLQLDNLLLATQATKAILRACGSPVSTRLRSILRKLQLIYMGKLPPFERHESGSFWSSTLRESKDSDPQPTSSKGRHSYEEETLRPHPLMSTQSFNSTIPKNFSNLKYTKTHDSGYGNSSSRYIPGPREDSPLRRMTKSRYTFVDPDSDDDRASRIHRVYDNADRRRRYASPEPVSEKQQSQTPRDSIRSPRAEAFARYDDVRTRDFAPGSRFQAADDTAPKRSKGRYQE